MQACRSIVIYKSYGQMLGPIDDNFTKYEPNLVQEWDRERNLGIEPEYFSTGSHQRVKWKCKNCNHVFENSINSRIRFHSGCPYCGYNIFDDKIHIPAIKRPKIISFGQNNLKKDLKHGKIIVTFRCTSEKEKNNSSLLYS